MHTHTAHYISIKTIHTHIFKKVIHIILLFLKYVLFKVHILYKDIPLMK